VKAGRWFEKVAAEPRAVYGINTGFGRSAAPGCLRRTSPCTNSTSSTTCRWARDPVLAGRDARHHGRPRQCPGRRLLRIRTEVVDLLLEALNRDLLPEIPSEGSVGASGDLAPAGSTWPACSSAWATPGWTASGWPPSTR